MFYCNKYNNSNKERLAKDSRLYTDEKAAAVEGVNYLFTL